MFARVQTVRQPAEKLDELSRIAEQQLPDAHRLPGFKGFYYLVDRQHAKALVISLWDAEENLRQLEAHAAVRKQVEDQAGVKSPPTEVFEVAVTAV
jgi:heme-degrading monooxygenase HmoA